MGNLAVNKMSLVPRNMSEAMEFAQMVANSDMVPRDYKGKPANVLVAIQWGYEIGLAPLQSLQNIAVINGRPSIYGDAMLALVKGSGILESIIETATATGATCTVKRRGEAEVIRSFSIDQAKKAGLWGKAGPWTQYPDRMLQMRARGLALRDVFPDVLKGMYIAEEAQDIPAEVVESEPVQAIEPAQEVKALPAPVEVVMPDLVPVEPVQSQSYREQQASELRNLRMKITAQAKAINFVGDDLKAWITDTHRTTWEQMTTGKAEIILADLVAMA